jgi:hypothetical protein
LIVDTYTIPMITESLAEKYIRGTEKKSIVRFVTAFLCHLTPTVIKGAVLPCTKIYINTRVIKHAYDKRTAEEFDFLIKNLYKIVKYPNFIYKNKSGKRGEYCFVKEINNEKYLCSIQFNHQNEAILMAYDIVTFFRTDDAYLKNYELLWEWKVGDPSS